MFRRRKRRKDEGPKRKVRRQSIVSKGGHYRLCSLELFYKTYGVCRYAKSLSRKTESLLGGSLYAHRINVELERNCYLLLHNTDIRRKLWCLRNYCYVNV